MLSKILECPGCRHQFTFEYDGDMPARITCPECEKARGKNEFRALIICSECRNKLCLPLGMIYSGDNACPDCGAVIDPQKVFAEESIDAAGGKSQLQDGEYFDKYKIIRLLGKGGMAEVYLAEHLLLNKLCALKLMRGNAASDDPVFVKRFLREAKISNAVEHENIVKVFDMGSDYKSGSLFIAMEYVEGRTLNDIALDRQLSEEELFDILKAMANALKALDEVKVVHRDIKPSNIMLSKDGVFKLMDLGIAKASGGESDEMALTMDSTTIGTPNYVSPEQCRSAHSADIRSDIYSLGATIYHLASGKLPFDGTTVVETLLRVMQEEPEPLKKLRPELSKKFIALIEMMMAKDPAGRPENPDKLLELLSKRKISAKRSKKSFIAPLLDFFRPAAASRGRYILRMGAVTVGVLAVAAVAAGLLFGKALSGSSGEAETAAVVAVQSRGIDSGKLQTKIKTSVKKELPQSQDAVCRQDAFYVNWIKKFSEAIATDAIQQKPLLIFFDDPDKPQSKDDIRRYLSGDYPEKRYMQENFVLLYLDCSAAGKGISNEHLRENKELFNKFCPADVELPVMAVTTPQGRLIGVLDDFVPEKFAEQLRGVRDDCSEWMAVYDNPERNIALRLKERKLYLRHLYRRKETTWNKEAVKYVKRQINELEKQQKIRAEVLAAAGKSYSVDLTDTFRKLVEDFLQKRRRQQRRAVLAMQQDDMLLSFLQRPGVDPNVFIKVSAGHEYTPAGLIERGGVSRTNKKFLKLLMDKKADVNLTAAPKENHTPVELLFFGREDVDTGSNGPLIFNLARRVDIPARQTIGINNDFQGARLLTLLSPQLNDAVDDEGRTVMHYAVERDDDQWVRELIYAGFTQGRRRDNNGASPWDLALRFSSRKCVELLKSLKLDTGPSSYQAQYDMACGLLARERKTIRIAIESGANPYRPWCNGMNILQNACLMGDLEMVKYLLEKHRMEPDRYVELPFNFISNPLHIAADTGRLDIMEALLRHNADPAVRVMHGRRGHFSLAAAIVYKHCRQGKDAGLCIDILRLLKRFNKNFDINAVEDNRTSLLFEACVMPGIRAYSDEQIEIIRFLLGEGADPSRQLICGKPLNSYPMHQEVIEFLSGKEPRKRAEIAGERVVESDDEEGSYDDTGYRSPSQSIISDLKKLIREGKEAKRRGKKR